MLKTNLQINLCVLSSYKQQEPNFGIYSSLKKYFFRNFLFFLCLNLIFIIFYNQNFNFLIYLDFQLTREFPSQPEFSTFNTELFLLFKIFKNFFFFHKFKHYFHHFLNPHFFFFIYLDFPTSEWFLVQFQHLFLFLFNNFLNLIFLFRLNFILAVFQITI